MFDDRPYTLDRVTRLALGVALAWGLIWSLSYLSEVLIPFAVALLAAYLLNPIVEWVQKLVKKRTLAVVLTLLGVLVLLSLVTALVWPMIRAETLQMGSIVTGLARNADWAARLKSLVPEGIYDAVRTFVDRADVQSWFSSFDFTSLAETALRKLLPGAWGLVSGALGLLAGLMGLVVIILYTVLLLVDYEAVKDGWDKLIPERWRSETRGFLSQVDEGMSRYFRTQALVAAIVGILFAIGFAVIGLPLGIVLGLFIGLLNMVPYLQIIGLVPALIFALFRSLETGAGLYTYPGLVLLVFGIVQGLQDGVLVPRLMGRAMGLSPALMLLSLAVWGKFLGLLGLIIALPMTVVLWAYYQRLVNRVGQPENETTPA